MQLYNVRDSHVVIPMYHLIKYNDNYTKTSESLWKYQKDDPYIYIYISQKIQNNLHLRQE